MKKVTLLMAMLLLGLQVLFAQTREITGVVTSGEDGAPIPGVSVIVKGTTLGTVTDMEGRYRLQVPVDAQNLTFSFVGMATQEIAIAGRSNISVVLQPQAIGVDEVVVTALGISREKKSLGYAVQDVKSDELVRAATPNVISSLAGKVAGVQITNSGGQIGASSRIVIRGNSSFGDNQPLIVVDGIPISNSAAMQNSVDYGSGLYDINPQDIESVSVLKGGAAAALYGMRAGNGVILITTKTGSGRAKGVSVNYDGNFNFDQVYSIQRWQDKYGQGYAGDEWYYKDAQSRGYTGSYADYAVGGLAPVAGLNIWMVLETVLMMVLMKAGGPRLDIGLMIPQYNSPVDASGNRTATPWVSNPNNINDFFEVGHTTNHNFSLLRLPIIPIPGFRWVSAIRWGYCQIPICRVTRQPLIPL
jgi:TonB-dependent SusC/RagA subfamily outer membrane receptor